MLELVTCKSERAARDESLLQERGCKAILHQSCRSEGALPILMFLQPEAVLQNHPRKKETRTKMTAHPCSPPRPATLPAPGLALPACGHSPSLLLGSAPSSRAEGQGGCATGQAVPWDKPAQGSSQGSACWQGDRGGQAAGAKVVGQGVYGALHTQGLWNHPHPAPGRD